MVDIGGRLSNDTARSYVYIEERVEIPGESINQKSSVTLYDQSTFCDSRWDFYMVVFILPM